MAARLEQVQEGIYVLEGGSNVGFLVQDGEALAVDMGMDRDAARRALRALGDLGAKPVGLFLTHAHADHFGGAGEFVQRTGVPVLASGLEAAVVRNPILEPTYLYGGASPPEALRQKFLLAPPCPVAQEVEPGPLAFGPFQAEVIALPGHAPGQVGLAWQGTLFCADAFFPQEVLEKHGVPYFYDVDAAVETLVRLEATAYGAYVAGHGPWRREVADVAAANRARLQEIRAWVWEATAQPQGTEALLAGLAGRYSLRLDTLPAFVLTRASLLAALTSLARAGEVQAEFADNRLLWRRA